MFDHWYVPAAIFALDVVVWIDLELRARRRRRA